MLKYIFIVFSVLIMKVHRVNVDNSLRLLLLQITISKDDTVILDGAGDKKAIEERCEQV